MVSSGFIIDRCTEIIDKTYSTPLLEDFCRKKGSITIGFEKMRRKPKGLLCYACRYSEHIEQTEKPNIQSAIIANENRYIRFRSNSLLFITNIINNFIQINKDCYYEFLMNCGYYYSKYHKIPVAKGYIAIVDFTEEGLVTNDVEFGMQRYVNPALQDGHEEYSITATPCSTSMLKMTGMYND